LHVGQKHPMTWHGLAVIRTGQALAALYVHGRQGFQPENRQRFPDPAIKDRSLPQANTLGK
jgi:hypothetical protein